ncbi:unnamed protein product, partial [Adineta steineri]
PTLKSNVRQICVTFNKSDNTPSNYENGTITSTIKSLNDNPLIEGWFENVRGSLKII